MRNFEFFEILFRIWKDFFLIFENFEIFFRFESFFWKVFEKLKYFLNLKIFFFDKFLTNFWNDLSIVRDAKIHRGFYQKAVVILTQLPFYNLYSHVIDLIAPEYFTKGEAALEARVLQDI